MTRFAMPAAAPLLAALAVASASAVPAHAASCGVTGSASAPTTTYDPFNPAGLATTTITLNLTRINPPGGSNTTLRVNFYLTSAEPGADGASIVATAVSGPVQASGTGRNIFVSSTATPPITTPTSIAPSATNPFLQLDFTGPLGSDTATVTFQVSLPPAANFNASTALGFNVAFTCRATGGKIGPFEQGGVDSNALVFPITVPSALQASYAGGPLDFGEVGGVVLRPGQTGPSTAAGNYVRVQSSGPYAVTLSSQNAFRLAPPGGNLADPVSTIRYQARFLGAVRNFGTSANPGAVALSQTCARAGVGAAFEDRLPVSAALEEGGAGKTPSSAYSDTLTVTVTPLAADTVAPVTCDAL